MRGALQAIVSDVASRQLPSDRGPQGPLSTELTRAIVERLQSGNQATNIFERQLVLEQAVFDNPLLAGNHVRLLQDGPETDRATFTAIPGVLVVTAA